MRVCRVTLAGGIRMVPNPDAERLCRGRILDINMAAMSGVPAMSLSFVAFEHQQPEHAGDEWKQTGRCTINPKPSALTPNT